MGLDLADDFAAAAAIRDQIATAFRKVDPEVDLNRLLASDSASDLMRTDICQGVVYAHSAMAWTAFESELKGAAAEYLTIAALGHSFGELTAHLAAGTLDTEPMSALVLRRGRVMLDGPEGALLNVEVLTYQELQQLVDRFCMDRPPDARVHIAISQAPRLHAVGGLSRGVDEFANFLRKSGVNFRPVTGVHKPLHTPFQREVRSRLEGVLAEVSFRPARFPVVSTASGRFNVPWRTDAELAAQMDSPLRFAEAVACVAALVPDWYVVFGPGSKVAELLTHYNGVDSDRIRVVERSAQVKAVLRELLGRSGRPPLPPRDRRPIRARLDFAKETLRGFDVKREGYLLLEPDGVMLPLEKALERSGTLIFLKGSFNPFHLGHVALIEASRRHHPGAWATFALSVHTTKKYLSRSDLLFRARLILRAGYPVVLSYSGYFFQNVSWLRNQAPRMRLVFPTGIDALRRLMQYFSPEDFKRHFADVVFEYAEREGGGTFLRRRTATRHTLASVL